VKKYTIIFLLFAFLHLFAVDNTNKLEFILSNIKKSIKSSLPIKMYDGGIIKNVDVNGKTLIMYLEYPYNIKVDKNNICHNNLIKDILNERGAVKYIVTMKGNKVTYFVDKNFCSK
jgi:hypothetical protein